MEFKIDETDDFDEEEIDDYNDDDNDNNIQYIEDEEFDPIGIDDKDEEDSSETPAYQDQDTEPDEDDDAYIDDDDLEDDSPVVIERVVVPEFTDEEANNFDYADAIRAYYEDNNYEYAIEQFSKVIRSEKRGKKKDIMQTNEILAKSLYWQAEAYVKTQDYAKAIKAFESLVNTCNEHYLILAARRRAANLKAKL